MVKAAPERNRDGGLWSHSLVGFIMGYHSCGIINHSTSVSVQALPAQEQNQGNGLIDHLEKITTFSCKR